jgi:ATP-dependent RNA helicase DHX37/DHR1
MYLRGVTAIDPQWIPVFCKTQCRPEQILQDPPPFYDPTTGTIMCHQKVSYGRQGWELPVSKMEYPRRLEKFKLFAQFLLEGKVFEKMSRWKEDLLSLPVTMVKPWAKLQPRTQGILKALTENGIQSKEDVEKMWTSNRTFLLKEYLEWIPSESHKNVMISWPPLIDDN